MSRTGHRGLGRHMVANAKSERAAARIRDNELGDSPRTLRDLHPEDRQELQDELVRRFPGLKSVPKDIHTENGRFHPDGRYKPPPAPKAPAAGTPRKAPVGRQGPSPRRTPPRAPGERVVRQVADAATAPAGDAGSFVIQILGGTILFAVLYAVLTGEEQGRGVVSFFGKAVNTGLNVFLRPVDPLNPKGSKDGLAALAAAASSTGTTAVHAYGQAGSKYAGPVLPSTAALNSITKRPAATAAKK